MNSIRSKGLSGGHAGKLHSLKTRKHMSEIRKGKSIPRFMVKVTCSHCNKIGNIGAMKRWYFDNCKLKKKN